MGGKTQTVEARKRYDDKLRRYFYILMLIFVIWIIYTVTMDWDGDLFALISSMLNGLVTIFLLLGIFSFYFYRKYGKIKTGDLLKVLVSISFTLTFLTIIIGYSLYRPFLFLFFEVNIPEVGFFLPVLVFLIYFLSYLTGLFLILLQSFGLMGLIVLLQRKYFHKIFENIKSLDLTGEKSRGLLKKAYQGFLRWIFDIPKVLDTEKIEIKKKDHQDNFSWKDFGTAFFLEYILAIVIAIYISLNPFLLAERSLNELFSLASAVSYFIPVIVIPFFIFRKLRVKIPGPGADFSLFEGARSKLLSLILTLGTILVFLRLALSAFDPGMLVYSFLFYLAGFLMNSFFITFVYFNYFEDPLVEDILEGFDKSD